MLLFLAFLIPLVHNKVSANKVVSYTQNRVGNQIHFPWKSSDDGKITFHSDFTIKTDMYGTYSVRCEVYQKKYPMMLLYTEDGILIEAGSVMNVDDKNKECDKSILGLMISPQKLEDQKIVIVYVHLLELSLVCWSRTYIVKRNTVMAEVKLEGEGLVTCTGPQKKYIDNRSFKPVTKSGCIVYFIKGKDLFEAPYKPQKQGVEVLRKDLKGTEFKITCSEHITYKGPTVLIGSVTHGDHAGVILESFEMKSCSLEHINVNRRIVNKEDHFKTVFKKADGTCEEREYKIRDDKTYQFYNRLNVDRSDPKRVPCPSFFVGDIGENAFLPWLRIRFLRNIVFKWFKPEPYSVEI